jgi:hypothetical protein
MAAHLRAISVVGEEIRNNLAPIARLYSMRWTAASRSALASRR